MMGHDLCNHIERGDLTWIKENIKELGWGHGEYHISDEFLIDAMDYDQYDILKFLCECI